MKPAHLRVNGRDVPASHEESILSAAAKVGVKIDFSCEGGTCGTCRVIVRSGFEKCPPRNEIEAETAADRGYRPEERLACQTEAVAGIDVVTHDFKD